MKMDEMLQKAKKTQVQRKKGPRWTGKKRVSGWPGSKIENWREDNACLWWNINSDDKSTCFTMAGKLKRAQVDWEGNWGEDSLSLSSTIYNLSISGKLKRVRVDWDGNWGEERAMLACGEGAVGDSVISTQLYSTLQRSGAARQNTKQKHAKYKQYVHYTNIPTQFSFPNFALFYFQYKSWHVIKIFIQHCFIFTTKAIKGHQRPTSWNTIIGSLYCWILNFYFVFCIHQLYCSNLLPG